MSFQILTAAVFEFFTAAARARTVAVKVRIDVRVYFFRLARLFDKHAFYVYPKAVFYGVVLNFVDHFVKHIKTFALVCLNRAKVTVDEIEN